MHLASYKKIIKTINADNSLNNKSELVNTGTHQKLNLILSYYVQGIFCFCC